MVPKGNSELPNNQTFLDNGKKESPRIHMKNRKALKPRVREAEKAQSSRLPDILIW